MCRVEAYAAKPTRESLDNGSNNNFRIRRSLWEERASAAGGVSVVSGVGGGEVGVGEVSTTCRIFFSNLADFL